MKKKGIIAIVVVSVCVLLAAITVVLGSIKVESKTVYSHTDIGVPYAEIYGENQLNSRLSADMIVFDGKLYIGGGDYGANTGPVNVISYDLEQKIWGISNETLPDEQIKRFRVLDGKLATLGTDPRGDWRMGNYYVLENGIWTTKSCLPSGIHCFDAIEFEGKTFFGLGCNRGDYPVVVYDGAEYKTVDFVVDGVPLDTSKNEVIRVYNLFEYQNNLYAFFSYDGVDENGATVYYMDLYIYDGGVFNFFSGTLLSEDMPEIITTESRAYIILNKTLLQTNDLLNYSAVSLGSNVTVADIIEDGDKIYVLASRKSTEGLYEIMVFENDGDGFNKELRFFAYAAAGAFCKSGNDFYISLGQRGQTEAVADLGRIYAVKGQKIETRSFDIKSFFTRK